MSIDLASAKKRISYALAMNIAESVRRMPVDLDLELIGSVFGGLLAGDTPQLEEKDFHTSMQELQSMLQNAARDAQSQAAQVNIDAENKFMSENGKKPEVKTTASGLQYQIIAAGTGETPKAASVVKVHYEGRLLDGTVFDSSVKRGEPAEFPVNQVIAGWTEALQLMQVGAKYRLFIPSKLAYGQHGAGNLIGPNAALVFDVELLGIVK